MKLTPLILTVLALVFTFNFVLSADSVNINFDVKDSNGSVLPDALVIMQGITSQNFSESKLTGSDGKVSFTVNKNELFVYIVYKLSYKEQTSSFLGSSDKNFQVNMEKFPDNQWHFYRINNGELEFRFKSLDDDINYEVNHYIKKTLEIRNVNEKEIKLADNGAFQVVDGQTLNQLRAWGDFDIVSESGLKNVVLKKNGLVSITFSENNVKVCASNVKVNYNGLQVELSGSESFCVDKSQQNNKIPAWILNSKYRFKIERIYEINGQQKNFNFTSQEFSINNIEWKPELITVPTTNLSLNQEWTYDANLKNYDESYSKLLSMIQYKLIDAPTGMAVDANSGIVKWTPTQAGSHNVALRVYHEYFSGDTGKIAFSDQQFTLTVNGVQSPPANNIPVITSTAVISVNESISYIYDVDAADADGDTLTYSLTQAPNWLSINSNTGVISGTSPSVATDTDFSVTVKVDDGKGGTDTETYTLKVVNIIIPTTNHAPFVTSSPVTMVDENAVYAYDVNANDEDGDTLTYSLTTGPTWLSISPTTGLITGTAPSVASDTNFLVIISVSDGQTSATQSYTITVTDAVIVPPTNNPPTINSAPVTEVNESSSYIYNIIATDPDGDSLEYSLIGPEWLSIDSTGLINGTAPEVSGDVDFNVMVSVFDGKGGIDFQTYTLTINNSPGGPIKIPRKTHTTRPIPADTFYETMYQIQSRSRNKNGITFNSIEASTENQLGNGMQQLLASPVLVLVLLNLNTLILINLAMSIRRNK